LTSLYQTYIDTSGANSFYLFELKVKLTIHRVTSRNLIKFNIFGQLNAVAVGHCIWPASKWATPTVNVSREKRSQSPSGRVARVELRKQTLLPAACVVRLTRSVDYRRASELRITFPQACHRLTVYFSKSNRSNVATAWNSKSRRVGIIMYISKFFH